MLVVIMANRNTIMFLLLFCVTLVCVYGSIETNLAKTKENNNELHYNRRYRRSSIDEGCSFNSRPGGYFVLKKDDVNVEFIKNDTRYIARLRWKLPKIKGNNSLATSFHIYWRTSYGSRCKTVKNKTTFDITPSKQWKFNMALNVAVFPLPVGDNPDHTLLRFEPTYKDVTATIRTEPKKSSVEVAATISSFESDVTPTIRTKPKKSSAEVIATISSFESDGEKMAIGSVTGVAIGILLIVVLVILYFKRKRKASGGGTVYQDFYYVSYRQESDKFTKKVIDFVSWLRENGFDAQMVDSMLSESNDLLLREIGPFRFGELKIGEAKNVLMVISPSYLSLCRLDEKEARKETLSTEEKIVYAEIVQIRRDLCENIFRSNRFIPILFDVNETELPYWIKELIIYAWPKDKNKLLYRINNVPEYSPMRQNDETA